MTEMEPGTECHITLSLAGLPIQLIRRPMSTLADEGTTGFLDGISDKGNPCRCVATFKNGKWGKGSGGGAIPFTPRSWTVLARLGAGADE